MTSEEFLQALRVGPYAWPGGYPLFFITSDAGCLCHDCGKKNRGSIVDAIEEGLNDGWRVVAQDVNWEDPELICDGCGDRIQSAYAEDEAEENGEDEADEDDEEPEEDPDSPGEP